MTGAKASTAAMTAKKIDIENAPPGRQPIASTGLVADDGAVEQKCHIVAKAGGKLRLRPSQGIGGGDVDGQGHHIGGVPGRRHHFRLGGTKQCRIGIEHANLHA